MAICLLLCVAPGFKQSSIWEVAAGELQRARAEAKAVGIPIEPSDFGSRNIPDQDNALTYYRQAFLVWHANDEAARNEALREWQLFWTAKELPEVNGVRSSIVANQDMIDLLVEGSNQTNCDFKRDYANGLAIPLQEIILLKNLIRALSADAVMSTKDDDPDRAQRNLIAIQKIAGHMAQDKIMICHLVAIALSKIGTRTAMRVLGEGGLEYLDAMTATRKAMPTLHLRDILAFETFGGALAVRKTKPLISRILKA